jgi:hypothetical protein
VPSVSAREYAAVDLDSLVQVASDQTFDLNGDGVVDAADVAAFRANFGTRI